MAAIEQARIVSGVVIDSGTVPVSEAKVRAFLARFRKEEVVGGATTDTRGRFEFEVDLPADFPLEGKLRLEARSTDKKSATGTASVGPLGLAELNNVTLRLAPIARDEYTIARAEVSKLTGQVSIADLRQDEEYSDLSFLSKEIGTSENTIMQMVVAERVSERLDVPAEAVYGLLRLGVPGSIPSDLLAASDRFELIDPLVDHVSTQMAELEPDVSQRALKSAITKRLVAGDLEEKIDSISSRLRDAGNEQRLAAPLGIGKTPLSDLLKLAGLTEKNQLQFASAWKDHVGSAERFWENLEELDDGFSSKQVKQLRRTLDVGALVKNHVPMMEVVSKKLEEQEIGLPQLARMELRDWQELIDLGGEDVVPGNIRPSENEKPAQLYAREVYERVQRRYPTTALAARIEREKLAPEKVREPLKVLFESGPELDLVQTNLGTWLEENGEVVLSDIDEPLRQDTVREVERMQRVLRISRNPEIGEVLLKSGLDSAAHMYELGKTQVSDSLVQRGLGQLEAERTYQVAAMRHSASMALLTSLNAQLRGIYPSATGPAAPFGDSVSDAIKRHPSLTNLFGSQDACAVDPCTSILSPAAYLSDLLLWMRNRRIRSSGAITTALNVFRARRPDILDLKFDCPNTNTPLPYIDLVNELLEDAVSPPSAPVSRQTTLTAEELRAAPEYVNDETYSILADAVFPHFLPYERAFDEMMIVLDRSEVPFWQLREGVLPVDAAPTAAQSTGIAAAGFGIGAAELALMTTPASSSGATPLTDVWNTANPVSDLATVADFLSMAQIDYDALLQLLACRWPQGAGDPMRITGADDRCDTTVQTLEGLNSDRLDRIHRFLRLWRHTDWDMWALDELLMAPSVGNGALDETAIRSLWTVLTLQNEMRLPIDVVLALWQDIGLREHRLPEGVIRPSLYARTFEDRSQPVAPELELAALLSASPPPPISDALPAIRAALSLTPEEAAVLVPDPSAGLTLAVLSEIYRSTTLARALRIAIDDAVVLAGGTYADAFTGPDATRTFANRATAVSRSGMDVPRLHYVLSNTLTSAARSEETLSEGLASLRMAIQRISDDAIGAADDPLATLASQLASLPSLADVETLETAVSIVDGSFDGSDAERNAFIATHFSVFIDTAAAQTLLSLPLTTPATPAGPREDEIEARANGLLTPLIQWQTESSAISTVATAFSMSEGHADTFMRRFDVPGESGMTLLTALTDPELIARDPATGDYVRDLVPLAFGEAFLALRLLDKLSVVVRAMRLSELEGEWLARRGSDIAAIDLAALPVVTGQPDQTVEAWLNTATFVALDRSFDEARRQGSAQDMTSLRALLDAVIDGTFTDEAEIHAALAGISGWDDAQVAAAASTLGIGSPPPSPAGAANPWLSLENLERIRLLLAMAEATGATVDQLAAWGDTGAPTLAHAQEAWQALRSRYSSEAWLYIAPSIMDPLRERRRDALVWYLLAQRDSAGDPVWGFDTADLFARFLLDTEMSSCQVTTRIVQAYASIQLFIQRILMNLERDAEADTEIDEAWKQWSWMDRYRVWEAARKVFLYPENWLIESQRPDRSEIFVALDRAVQQREATSDSLQSAAMGYLDQLSTIARPKVTGLCSEPGSGTLYAVGRVADDPAQFFVRKFEHRKWGPWQNIPVDIAAQHVTPAFYGGRIHLFWIRTVVANEAQQRLTATVGEARNSEAPDRYIELKLYVTSLRDGQWLPPRVSGQSLFDKPFFPDGRVVTDQSVEALYTIKTRQQGVSLLIDIYRTGPTTQEQVAEAKRDARSFPDLLPDLLGSALHLARVSFDGRFTEVQLRDLTVDPQTKTTDPRTGATSLLARARTLYDPNPENLAELVSDEAEPDLARDAEMRHEAGALVRERSSSSSDETEPLRFDATVSTGTLLNSVATPFRVIGLTNDAPFTPESPFVFSDPERTWFAEPTRYWRRGSVWSPVAPSVPGSLPTQLEFQLHRFYHPFVASFQHVLSSTGFDGLYRPEVQSEPGDILPDTEPFSFRETYRPHPPLPARVKWGSDTDLVEFEYGAPSAGYNWELFFHLPYFIARKLAQNQRFEEARDWLQYIFDPTRVSTEASPQRFWITRPFRELSDDAVQAQRINDLLMAINRRDADALGQVSRWREDPFNPYLLADMRPVAYMKRVVMSYLDTLIGWGDALFATASREALNEATLLYVMASELLGPRPEFVPPPERASASWNELAPEMDAFANALVAIENYVPPGTGSGGTDGTDQPPLPPGQTFYFKIPPNQKLLDYWDTVDDRLFKLRNCLGLGGEPLLLPLFDAPIDPALLVRARAGNLDLGSVLLELGGPLPNYRFFELHRRATEYTDAVISMGQALLSALEARDSEQLATLLVTQRERVQADSKQILEWQLEEAKALAKGVEYGIELEDERIASARGAYLMTGPEAVSATLKVGAGAMKLALMFGYLIKGGAQVVPKFAVGAAGVGGSPQANAESGGDQAGKIIDSGLKAQEKVIESFEKTADVIKIFAEAGKKLEEKQKEGKYAQKRKKTLEEQFEAANIRVQIAEYRLEQLDKADDELAGEREFLQSKFSNEDLYDWMVGQLSDIYFRAFRLALSMAHRTERCYRFELGLTDSSIIGPGSWDNLRRGLLAGESLAHDLRRLEASYLERNVRRREITRTVSLLEEFPDQLITLLMTGTADVELDELLFDRDYPGHYQRRIARVSVTVDRPGAHEHDNVVCSLTLKENSVRLVPSLSSGYDRLSPHLSDTRFFDQFVAVQSIVTGNAIDDPGLFERDIGANLSDPRYLPFENAGAISRWQIELPAARNAIDLSTVQDVKLHVHYTALDGGKPLVEAAQTSVKAATPSTLAVAWDVATKYPDLWEQLFAGSGEQRIDLPLRSAILPPAARGRNAVVTGCTVHLINDAGREYDVELSAPFPTTLISVDSRNGQGLVATGALTIPNVPLQPLGLRVRERGSADWTSLTRDRLAGMIVELQLSLS